MEEPMKTLHVGVIESFEWLNHRGRRYRMALVVTQAGDFEYGGYRFLAVVKPDYAGKVGDGVRVANSPDYDGLMPIVETWTRPTSWTRVLSDGDSP